MLLLLLLLLAMVLLVVVVVVDVDEAKVLKLEGGVIIEANGDEKGERMPFMLGRVVKLLCVDKTRGGLLLLLLLLLLVEVGVVVDVDVVAA